MKVMIFLLLASFVVGGSVRGEFLRRRPLVVFFLVTVVAASYLSTRVVG